MISKGLPDNISPIAAAITAVVGLLSFLIFARLLLRWFRGKRKDSIVILGPSRAGKTKLFELLRSNIKVNTYTSLETSEDTISFSREGEEKKKSVLVTECPGSLKMRRHALEKVASSTVCLYIVRRDQILGNKSGLDEAIGYLISVIESIHSSGNSKHTGLLVAVNDSQNSNFGHESGLDIVKRKFESEMLEYVKRKMKSKNPDAIYDEHEEKEERAKFEDLMADSSHFEFSDLELQVDFSFIDVDAGEIYAAKDFILDRIS